MAERILAPQLPYSSDLAPSDFNPFGALKDAIPGKILVSCERVTANSEFQLFECDREASSMKCSWPTRSYIYIYVYYKLSPIKKYKIHLTCLVFLLMYFTC